MEELPKCFFEEDVTKFLKGKTIKAHKISEKVEGGIATVRYLMKEINYQEEKKGYPIGPNDD